MDTTAQSRSVAGDDEDGALVQRARTGERAALAALFARHHARVFRSAYLVTRSPEAADDIVQIVFLELFTALHTFDPRRPFVPWLYRIVHNVSIDFLKRERYRLPMVVPLADTIPGPIGEIGRADLRADVRPALDGLSAEHREVLVLRYYVGLLEREMADVLGVRPGTVKSRLNRALHALKEVLGPGDAPTADDEPGVLTGDGTPHGGTSHE